MRWTRWLLVAAALLGASLPGGCEVALAGTGEVEEMEGADMAVTQVVVDPSQAYRVPQTTVDAVRALDLYQAARLRLFGPTARYTPALLVSGAAATNIVPQTKRLRFVRAVFVNQSAVANSTVLVASQHFDANSGGSAAIPGALFALPPSVLANAVLGQAQMETILLPGEGLWAQVGTGLGNVLAGVTIVEIETGAK